jgi:mannose-6-phosphate isomerase
MPELPVPFASRRTLVRSLRHCKGTLNGEEILVKTGEVIDVVLRDTHRIENPDVSETLVFIETQTGTYFGEDDTKRLEGDFERN